MPREHVNRNDVDARFERLRDRYGAFPVVEGTEVLPAERFDPFLEAARDGYTGGGYAWVVREPADAPAVSASMPDAAETESVSCLIQHRGDGDRWRLPGGGREDGETSEEATIREVREETALDVTLDAPFLVYRATHEPDDGRAVRVHTLWVCFDAAFEAGHLEIQPTELRGAAWLAEPPRALGPWSQYRASSWWDDFELAEPWWAGPDPDPYAVTLPERDGSA